MNLYLRLPRSISLVSYSPFTYSSKKALKPLQRNHPIVGTLVDLYRTRQIARSIVEHEKFANAFLERDAELAEKMMVDHLKLVHDELVSLLVNIVLPYARDGI